MVEVVVFEKDHLDYDHQMYKWTYLANTMDEMITEFKKRFGNIVDDYPRMFMRKRLENVRTLSDFNDAINRSRYYSFVVSVGNPKGDVLYE